MRPLPQPHIKQHGQQAATPRTHARNPTNPTQTQFGKWMNWYWLHDGMMARASTMAPALTIDPAPIMAPAPTNRAQMRCPIDHGATRRLRRGCQHAQRICVSLYLIFLIWFLSLHVNITICWPPLLFKDTDGSLIAAKWVTRVVPRLHRRWDAARQKLCELFLFWCLLFFYFPCPPSHYILLAPPCQQR